MSGTPTPPPERGSGSLSPARRSFRRWLWLHPHIAIRRGSRWVFYVHVPPWVAYEMCEVFTELRCRRVWLVYRTLTEADAEESWLDDWYPGYTAWIGCKATDEGAVAWWEVDVAP